MPKRRKASVSGDALALMMAVNLVSQTQRQSGDIMKPYSRKGGEVRYVRKYVKASVKGTK